MEKIIDKDWEYSLYQTDDNNFLFSVLCGSIAMDLVNFQLNKEERNEFEEKGQIFLDVLAEDVRQNQSKYNSRHIQKINP